jgi:hypothetical protein
VPDAYSDLAPRSVIERHDRESTTAGYSENKFTNADLLRIKAEIKYQVEQSRKQPKPKPVEAKRPLLVARSPL